MSRCQPYRLPKPLRGLTCDVLFVVALGMDWLPQFDIFDLRVAAWALHCRYSTHTPNIFKAMSEFCCTLAAQGELRMLKSFAAWYPESIVAHRLYATVFGYPSKLAVLKWMLETYPINLDLEFMRKAFASAPLKIMQTVVPQYAQVSPTLFAYLKVTLLKYCKRRNIRVKCTRATKIMLWLRGEQPDLLNDKDWEHVLYLFRHGFVW